jgi:hypothetical protein
VKTIQRISGSVLLLMGVYFLIMRFDVVTRIIEVKAIVNIGDLLLPILLLFLGTLLIVPSIKGKKK